MMNFCFPDPSPSLFREVPSYNQIVIAETLESLLCELSETRRLYIHVYELTNPFRIYNTPGQFIQFLVTIQTHSKLA